MFSSMIEHASQEHIADSVEAPRRKISDKFSKSFLVGSLGEGLAVPDYFPRSGTDEFQFRLVSRDTDEMTLHSNLFEVSYQRDKLDVISTGKRAEMESLEGAEATYVRLKVTAEYSEATAQAETPISRITALCRNLIYGQSNDTNTGLWAKAKSHI